MSHRFRTEGDRAKDFAAEINRTYSTLRKLSAELDGLSDGDRRKLLDAAAILAAAGREKKASAKKLKDAEIAIEKAFDKAEAEAGAILDAWPQSDLPDQIALCLSWNDPWNLEGEKDLRERLKGYTDFNGKHYPATRRSLQDVLNGFKRALQREAAARASRKGQPVAEFLGTVRAAAEVAKQSDKCRELVQAWRVALVAEQITEANKGGMK
jgi:hypothetical protein